MPIISTFKLKGHSKARLISLSSCEYLEKAESDVRVALNLLGVMKQNQAPISSIKRPPPPPPPQVVVEQKIDLDAVRALILAKSRHELSETVSLMIKL